jgi:hypothetical protein
MLYAVSEIHKEIILQLKNAPENLPLVRLMCNNWFLPLGKVTSGVKIQYLLSEKTVLPPPVFRLVTAPVHCKQKKT